MAAADDDFRRPRLLSIHEREARERRLRMLRFRDDGSPKPLEERVETTEEILLDALDEQLRLHTALKRMEQTMNSTLIVGNEAKQAIEDTSASLMRHMARLEAKVVEADSKRTKARSIRSLSTKEVILIIAALAAAVSGIIGAARGSTPAPQSPPAQIQQQH